MSRYGQCYRGLICPANHRTPAQQYMRGVFGNLARAWGRTLSPAQRDVWNAEGPTVWSHPRCGSRGRLTGQQFFEGINAVRGRVGLPPAWVPPPRHAFPLSVVRELVITTDEGGARLFLRLAGTPTEDVMVFGQAPCSAGRSRRRNVAYLGLLGPAADGMSEVTDLYKARFGEPRPGTKVFIVTCQQRNGWKGMEHETSEIVPGVPAKHAKGAKGEELKELNELSGLNGEGVVGGKGENGLKPIMHKGCTRGAQGTNTAVGGSADGGAGPMEGGGKAAGTTSGGDGVASEEGDAPV